MWAQCVISVYGASGLVSQWGNTNISSCNECTLSKVSTYIKILLGQKTDSSIQIPSISWVVFSMSPSDPHAPDTAIHQDSVVHSPPFLYLKLQLVSKNHFHWTALCSRQQGISDKCLWHHSFSIWNLLSSNQIAVSHSSPVPEWQPSVPGLAIDWRELPLCSPAGGGAER